MYHLCHLSTNVLIKFVPNLNKLIQNLQNADLTTLPIH